MSYLNHLFDSEEMQFYIENFGGSSLKKSPTREKYKHMDKEQLLEIYE